MIRNRRSNFVPQRLTFGLFVFLLAGFLLAEGAVPSGAQNQKKKKGKMAMKCPMMAGMKGVDLYADSPEVLLARAEHLELSKKQKARLEKIATAARRRARRVLTEEQRKEIKNAPHGPLSMMEITKLRMKDKGHEKEKGHMCPMCMKMMHKMMEKKKGRKEKD